MQLPAWLRDAIEAIAGTVPQRDLARAAAELSEAYRAGDFRRAPLDSDARRAAYLAQRLPATYAACARVFEEIRSLAPGFAPETMLDLGAGPGTATFAAAESWTSLRSCTLVERDAPLIELGKRLFEAAESSRRDAAGRVSTTWIATDLKILSSSSPFSEGQGRAGPGFSRGCERSEHRADNNRKSIPASAAEVWGSHYDLVIFSYALGEFSKPEQQRLIDAAWGSTAQLLILIEPGTPRGFSHILAARDALSALGAHIVAPCPRADAHPCPMAEAGDWCHFAQRVERSSLHRKLKGGELGYEDEKFSYVVLSRQPLANAAARIVRHPVIGKGHVELQLCTPGGLQRVTVGKSHKERYRAARKAEWGDPFQI